MDTPKTQAAFYRGNHTLQLGEISPHPPGEYEVSIRVAYCGICGSDIHIYHGDMDTRVGQDRIIGHEMSGVVDTVGKGVTRFRPGDRVTVRPIRSCGKCPACRTGYSHVCYQLNCLGVDSDGALQGIWNVPEDIVYPLPSSVSLMQAALIEPTAVSCHSVRLAKLQPGEDVLVIGCGTIGILTALNARTAGGRVSISEINPHRVDLAKKLGFTVINPNREDLPRKIGELTGNKGAEIVFEVSGHPDGAKAMTDCAAARARIMMVAIHPTSPPVDLLQVFRRELQIIGTRIQEPEDFEKAISLIASQEIDAEALVTDIRPLKEIQQVFEEMDGNPALLKTLIAINQ